PLQELEFTDVDGRGPSQAIIYAEQGHGDFVALLIDEEHPFDFVIDTSPAETAADEVGIKHAASIFTVCNGLQSELFLHCNRSANQVIFELAQLGDPDSTRLEILSRLQQLGRP